MDRREAIKAAAASATAVCGIPFVGTELSHAPDEVAVALVFRSDLWIPSAGKECIRKSIAQALAGTEAASIPVMVIDGGADLRLEKVKKSGWNT